MNINREIKDAIIMAGWTTERYVSLPKFYKDKNCSELASKVISNLYKLDITFKVLPEYPEHIGYKTKFIICQNDIDYFESTQQEFKEITGINMKVYPIGERSDGLSLYIDDYRNFFGENTIGMIEYLGNSLEEMFTNVLLHECYYSFEDGIFSDGYGNILKFDPKIGIIK